MKNAIFLKENLVQVHNALSNYIHEIKESTQENVENGSCFMAENAWVLLNAPQIWEIQKQVSKMIKFK